MKKIILLRHGEVDIRNCENITAKQRVKKASERLAALSSSEKV